MPKVSIIMGVYNVKNENMARTAIESILNQTFSDFEFIICDDGSTNGTYAILKDIIGQDERVILIRNDKNMGLAYSLNQCLKIAKGEYIARMDIDDISYLDRLKVQVDFLDNNSQYALIGSWAELFDENGIFGLRRMKINPIAKDFLFGSPIIHTTMLMKKEILKKLDGYRVAWDTTRAEDYDLFMRLYALGEIAYNLQIPLYKIREDKDAYKRRSYKHRFEEAHVRMIGFKKLKLYPIAAIYVLKPLIVGLFPQSILKILRRENIK